MLKKSLILLIVLFGMGLTTASAQTEQKVKTITKGIINGLATKLPKPVYPAEAKAAGASGVVNIEVLIDENGNVLRASAVDGHPLLRESSEKAARGAKFKPIRLNGEAVRAKGIVVYKFIP